MHCVANVRGMSAKTAPRDLTSFFCEERFAIVGARGRQVGVFLAWRLNEICRGLTEAVRRSVRIERRPGLALSQLSGPSAFARSRRFHMTGQFGGTAAMSGRD
jgi:hypothetical protein